MSASNPFQSMQTLLATSRQDRLAGVADELAGDPMVVDSNDLIPFHQPLGSSATPSSQYCCGTKPQQRIFLIGLPDEILLHVVTWLLRDSDCKSVESFSLTCRRFHTLTTDPTLLNQYMASAFPWETQYLYSYIDWTISNIKRFFKYAQQEEQLVRVLGKYISRHRTTRMGFETGNWSGIVSLAIKLVQAMDGLQDNSPNHEALEHLPFPWIVALHYTSLIYGRKFMAAHNFKLRSTDLSDRGMWEQQALRYVSLREGAHEAMKLLLWDAQPDSQFKNTVRRFKAHILSCREFPTLFDPVPLCVSEPENWIVRHLEEHRDSWLRETVGGTHEEAWAGSGLSREGRGCILACLHGWRARVPYWMY